MSPRAEEDVANRKKDVNERNIGTLVDAAKFLQLLYPVTSLSFLNSGSVSSFRYIVDTQRSQLGGEIANFHKS